MRNQNRKSFNNRRNNKPNLNREIRKRCCWNCFQTGHLRYQCPFPKVDICSFCRHPGTRSSECKCLDSRTHFSTSIPIVTQPTENSNVLPNYELNVVVPMNAHLENPQYEEMDNIVVFVDNNQNIHEDDDNISNLYDEEDADIIELYAEEDDLSEM